MERRVDLSGLLLPLLAVVHGVLAALGPGAIGQRQLPLGPQEPQRTQGVAPGTHRVRLRGRSGAAGMSGPDGRDELCWALRRHVRRSLGEEATVAALAQAQFGHLLLRHRREEVEAAVAAELDELHLQPFRPRLGAFEQVLGGHLFDGRHRVRLAAAGLTEHEHRADAALTGGEHEVEGGHAVDLAVFSVLAEDLVVLELEVVDEGGL
mmetsp:Transcript_24160/g.69902  ORF Transcript_24160/g.69902 Transcript_24160/m.69902 type:complete len:208 (-) Transcript_24160:432-1055(-)